MAKGSSSDKWIGIAGIGSAIAGIGALLSAPGGVRWEFLLPIVAGCVVFFGALVIFDRRMVKTGRVGESTAALVFMGAIIAAIAALFVIAAD